MIKAAVIGVGSIGQNHARVYRELQNVKLIAVSDNDEATAKRVGERLAVDYVGDYVQLLDEYKPDLVSVSVPTIDNITVESASTQTN